MSEWLLTSITFLLSVVKASQYGYNSFDEAYLNSSNTNLGKSVYFEHSASQNVTAIVGQAAFLNCRIRNLGDRTVSWIRHRDINLLTVGRFTYSADERFNSLHNEVTGDWTLQIKYTQKKDSGAYECQVSTTPPIGIVMYLLVVEPNTTIVGGPDLYINTGSTVNLTCVIQQSPEPPQSILWTHNNQEINYDSPRGGVSVITEKGETTTSYLLIQRARKSDSGRYTCIPSNANSFSVNVHILNGEYPAAMQRSGSILKSSLINSSQINLIIMILISSYFYKFLLSFNINYCYYYNFQIY